MNKSIGAKALVAAGLAVCAAVLAQRMMDAREAVAVLRETTIAFGAKVESTRIRVEMGMSPERINLGVSTEDLFGKPRQEPAPEAKTAKTAEPPAPPVFHYRYLGRVQAQHYLERDGQLIAILAGTVLRDGFEIVSIDERQVMARHRATNLPVTISLPTLRE